MTLRAELQQASQRESHVVTSTARHIEAARDQRVQQSEQSEARLEDNLTHEALQKMTVMRQQLQEQEIAMQKLHQDAAFELEHRNLELEHKARLVSTEMDDDVKHCKDLEVETLESEPAYVKQKAAFALEKERAEYERQMHSQAPVYSEAPQTNPYTPPVVRWAAAAQVPPAAIQASPALPLGVSANNVHNLQTRGGGGRVCQGRSSTMTTPVRRRMRTKTPPQPETAGNLACPTTYAKQRTCTKAWSCWMRKPSSIPSLTGCRSTTGQTLVSQGALPSGGGGGGGPPDAGDPRGPGGVQHRSPPGLAPHLTLCQEPGGPPGGDGGDNGPGRRDGKGVP